jgi:hypothetical protein
MSSDGRIDDISPVPFRDPIAEDQDDFNADPVHDYGSISLIIQHRERRKVKAGHARQHSGRRRFSEPGPGGHHTSLVRRLVNGSASLDPQVRCPAGACRQRETRSVASPCNVIADRFENALAAGVPDLGPHHRKSAARVQKTRSDCQSRTAAGGDEEG